MSGLPGICNGLDSLGFYLNRDGNYEICRTNSRTAGNNFTGVNPALYPYLDYTKVVPKIAWI